ncbi:MAG: glycosyltransferase, partial [Chloroflexota bacterium]
VFTLGSAASLEPGDFYRQSADAAREVGRRAVLIGAPADSPGLASGDDGVWLEPWLPLPPIFQRAAAVIHHGGIGVTSHALAAGKPMLVVPHAHDQPDNARRAERLGVALAIPRGRYEAGRAASALLRLTGDPSFTVRAGELAGAVRVERGGAVAAAAVERAIHER